jgi:N-acetylmuramoyl-L-alanine amidase
MPQWKGIVGTSFTPEQFDTYVRGLNFGLWRPQFVVLHNTSAPKLSQWHSTPGAQRMKNLEHFYRDQQKWSAGPHLFIADDLIWVFTPLTTSGRHSPSWNSISWGVEMVGEYDVEPFGAGVRDNTVAALTTLHALGGLAPNTLKFHKEDTQTTHKNCPGKNVSKADIIASVTAAINARTAGEHQPGGGDD